MRPIAISIAAFAAAALAGCGSGEPPATPSACLQGPGAYLTALESAPNEVRLADGTAISECLVDEQQPGALATVGEAMIAAAGELNREARRDPDGQATVKLGYLVGAVQDAAAGTGGIHEDLKLRLDTAARFNEGEAFPASFERAFGEGYAAGQAGG